MSVSRLLPGSAPRVTAESGECAPPRSQEFAEERPNPSHDGPSLFFDSLRPGGVNDSHDIRMSPRTPSGH